MHNARSLFLRSRGAWMIALVALASVVWAWSPRGLGEARERTPPTAADVARAPDNGRAIGQGPSLDQGPADSPRAPIAAGVGSVGTPDAVPGNASTPPSDQSAVSPMPLGSSSDIDPDERRPPATLPEPETLTAESHTVRYAQAARTVRYEIVFNRAPDFLSTAGAGAQADSFQFHMDTAEGDRNPSGAAPLPWETIVRGEEIHVNGDVPIRSYSLDGSADPDGGGWDRLMGSVGYELKGKTLVFTAPFSMLNTESGKFSYVLELYRYGAWTGASYDDKSQPLRRRDSLTDRGR